MDKSKESAFLFIWENICKQGKEETMRDKALMNLVMAAYNQGRADEAAAV